MKLRQGSVAKKINNWKKKAIQIGHSLSMPQPLSEARKIAEDEWWLRKPPMSEAVVVNQSSLKMIIRALFCEVFIYGVRVYMKRLKVLQ